jgi:hypothetical protein
MAIAFDATSGLTPGWATSSTFAHTCSGSDRLLLFWVFFDRGAGTYNVSSAAYAGVAMTQIGTVTDSARHVELWALAGPASGTNNVVATYNNTGPTAKLIIRAVSYNGVDGTTPYGTFASATGFTTSATVNVASATGEMVADFCGVQSGGASITVGSGQTSRYEIDGGASGVGAVGWSDEPGAGTVTMSWSGWITDNWLIGAIPLKPVGVAAGGVPKTTKQTLLGVG